jgi:hypothetical protein
MGKQRNRIGVVFGSGPPAVRGAGTVLTRTSTGPYPMLGTTEDKAIDRASINLGPRCHLHFL